MSILQEKKSDSFSTLQMFLMYEKFNLNLLLGTQWHTPFSFKIHISVNGTSCTIAVEFTKGQLTYGLSVRNINISNPEQRLQQILHQELEALGQRIPLSRHVLPVLEYESRSPPKFNHLFIDPLPTFPENFMQIRLEVFAESC